MLTKMVDGVEVVMSAEEEAEIRAQWDRPPTAAEFNAPIKAQIAALDAKRIRPLAEGDSAYLDMLNTKIVALRATLVKE